MKELYKKHRPKTFKNVLGQNLTAIQKHVEKGTVPQTILLSGPSGCGKTTIGRILKRKLHCNDGDFNEMNAAQETGIDAIRKIDKRLYTSLSLTGGQSRIWLIDECHMLSKPAQNSLLKMLEDTPANTYFLLATTDPQKLLKTIQNRAMKITLKALSDSTILELLEHVCSKEGIDIHTDVQSKIVEYASGSARQALVYLDTVYQLDDTDKMLNAIVSVSMEAQAIEIARALIGKPTWKKMGPLLKNVKDEDPEGIRRLVLAYTSAIMRNGSMLPQCYLILDAFSESYFYTGHAGLCKSCYEVVSPI